MLPLPRTVRSLVGKGSPLGQEGARSARLPRRELWTSPKPRPHGCVQHWPEFYTTLHSEGLGGETVFRQGTIEAPPALRDALRNSKLEVHFVFDRQPRPHLVLTCKQLTGKTLGTAPRRPSYWDLPIDLQANLLQRQVSVANELHAQRVEVHLGSWVSSQHIHAHVVLGLLPYFELRAAYRNEPKWTPDDAKRRARYVAKARADHNRYHDADKQVAWHVITSGTPQRTADVSAFEAVVFDADQSGTSAIDLTFKGAPSIKTMTQEMLRGALAAICTLCDALEIDGAHLLLPAPALGEAGGAHQSSVARLVIRCDLFVGLLPPERRETWIRAWSEGDPIARAYKEDMSLLDEVEEQVEGVAGPSSLNVPPPRPRRDASGPIRPMTTEDLEMHTLHLACTECEAD